jgi:hypothetical protein
MAALKWGVVLAAAYSAAALAYLVFKAFSFGRKPASAEAQGSARRGVAYALGKGLLPWEKESARLHLFTYLGGVAYHAGIFAGFTFLFMKIFAVDVPSFLVTIPRIFMALGLVSGLGLLVKRISKPLSRGLSCPDDFGANIFVDIFLGTALAVSFDAKAVAFLFAYSIFLFVFLPAGKIRHCFFFFCSRIFFGQFFGRRGVLPPHSIKS